MTTNEKLMLTALKAVISRIDAMWEDSTLPIADVRAIASMAVKAAEVEDTIERDMFKAYASTFGLTADDFGKTFRFRKNLYRIVGCRPKSFKYPILGARVPDGKTFKFPADHVAKNLGAI